MKWNRNISPLWVCVVLFLAFLLISIAGDIGNGSEPSKWYDGGTLVVAVVASLLFGLTLNTRLADVGDTSVNKTAARLWRRAALVIGGGLVLVNLILLMIQWSKP